MPHQIMYSSQATEPMTVTGLEAILTDARTGNEARNVTGALVYVDGVFFQILEGDEDVVRKLMKSIASDSRHRSVKVIYEADVDAVFGRAKGLGATVIEEPQDQPYGDRRATFEDPWGNLWQVASRNG